MIANVSHELRTPLGLIKAGSTALLMEGLEIDPEMRRHLIADISHECDRLEKIVDDLLLISRIESRQLSLDKQPADLAELARVQIVDLDHQFPNHEFICLFPSVPLVAEVDSSQMEQVLRNLLSNAAKYAPDSTRITIKCELRANDILLQVADQGIGIHPDELEKIFERFYRVKNEQNMQVGGVGLGLAMCRGIVEAHGGRIWAESVPGEGSVFNVLLPLPGKEERV